MEKSRIYEKQERKIISFSELLFLITLSAGAFGFGWIPFMAVLGLIGSGVIEER